MQDDADLAAERSLNTTNYVKEQWIPGTTCTPCGRSAASGPCNPAGSAEPPFALSAVTGKYASISSPFGDVVVGVTSTENDGQQLTLSVGPVQNAALVFSNTSAVGTAPCAALAANLPVRVDSKLPYILVVNSGWSCVNLRSIYILRLYLFWRSWSRGQRLLKAKSSPVCRGFVPLPNLCCHQKFVTPV